MIREQINNNYVFLNKINSLIKSNLLKFRKISIIINISNENRKEIELRITPTVLRISNKWVFLGIETKFRY